MRYYNISHQEEGSGTADYLIVSHHTNIPMRDEVMLIGTFGEKEVDFSLHRLKKSKELDRNLAFNIRRKSSTSLRTRIQFEKPFLYSTSTWGSDGCDKNVSQIIAPQPLYDTQGQPLKLMNRKKKEIAGKQDGEKGKFVYELLTGQTSPHIKFTVPGEWLHLFFSNSNHFLLAFCPVSRSEAKEKQQNNNQKKAINT